MLGTLLKAAALALCIAATPALAQTQAEGPTTTAPIDQATTGPGSDAFARFHFRRWRFYRHHHRHYRRFFFRHHHHHHHWRWYWRHHRHHFHRFHFRHHHRHWHWRFRGHFR